MKRLLLALLLVSVSACSGSDTPAAPSAPVIAQVAGVWTGVATLTSASGGECVGTIYQGLVGSRNNFTASISQAGSTLTATVTSQSDGTSCSYSGTAGSNTVSLNATSCQVSILTKIRCANGSVRDIQLFADAITASVNANTATGTEAETWNTFVSGTSSGVGILILNASFTMSK